MKKKQNGASNKLLLKNKTVSEEASQENVETPYSLDVSIRFSPKQKRTFIKRRRLTEIYASLDKLAAATNNESAVPSPKTDEKQPKRRRGRPKKSARNLNLINKTSTLRREERDHDAGVLRKCDEGKRCENHNKMLVVNAGVGKKDWIEKNGSKDAETQPHHLMPLLPLLPPPQEPQSWQETSPPFIDKGKGKEIAVDVETDNIYHIGSSSSEEYDSDGATKARKRLSSLLTLGSAATSLQSQQPPQLPPGPSHTVHEFMKVNIQEPPSPLPSAVPDVPQKFRFQDCVEALYGGEFSLKSEQPVVGLHTAMMVIAQNPDFRDALKALIMNISQSPSPPAARTIFTTTTTTPTDTQQFMPPPPAFTASGHEIEDLELSLATPNQNLFRPDIYGRVQEQPADVMVPYMQMPVLPPRMIRFGFPNVPGNYLQGDPGPSGDGSR